MEMWLRAAAISDVGWVGGADQAYYRVHTSSMQRTVHAGFLFDLEGRRKAFRSAFSKEAGQVDGADQLREAARHSLALTAIQHARRVQDSGKTKLDPPEAYCRFASSLHPKVVQSKIWRAVQRNRAGGKGLPGRPARRLRSVIREVMDRLAWRRWWRTGIFMPR